MSNLSAVMNNKVCSPNTIPINWDWFNLIDICSPKQWKTISASDMTANGFPVFGANSFVGFYPEYNHDSETIAITCRGNTCGTINKIPAYTYITGNSMALDDIDNTKILHNFLYYALIYRSVSDAISGSAQPQITGTNLKHIKIPSPPLPEQQKIAAILTSVDEVIEKTQAQIDKLKDLKTGMMQSLLTNGVGIDGKPHTEFKDSPVGRIPKGWEVVSIGELLSKKIIESIQDGNHGEKHPKSADFVSSGIPFVMASDIHNQTIDIEGTNKIPVEIYNNLRIGFSKAGDVLLSHKATVGLTAVVPDHIDRLMLTPQVTYYRIGDTSKLLNWYLHYSFQSSYFQKTISLLSAQSTRSYIGIKAQRELEIIVPNSVKEQQKIVEILQSLDTRINCISTKLLTLKDTKKALMQDLLTGKVRVSIEGK